MIGRVRDRFGAAVATFDANGDGKLDIYLTAAVVGPKGLRDALLVNQGNGSFLESAAAFGLPLDQASLGVAAADFDADRQIDLFLTGVGKNLLLRNRDGKGFEDRTQILKTTGPPALSLMARWLDLDQDGDLDLYVVNYCAAEHADKAFIADQSCLPGSPIRHIATTDSPSRFQAVQRLPMRLWRLRGRTSKRKVVSHWPSSHGQTRPPCSEVRLRTRGSPRSTSTATTISTWS